MSSLSLHESASNLIYGRFLDHAIPPDAPLTGHSGNKAAVTKDGYCIEYRETLKEHYERYMRIWEKKPISYFAIGMTRGL